MGFFKKKRKPSPNRILQEGWQFYHRPTTLEPVGTVFRIDDEHRRYIVDELTIETSRGKEAGGHLEDQTEVGAGMLARLLGIGPEVDSHAKTTEKVVFELRQAEREISTDMAVATALDPFLEKLKYRVDNRYFLIRECRWARAMTYRLSKQRVAEFGGETTLHESLTIGANLKSGNSRAYEIDCAFDQEMRVMFLPEEIKPVSAGLGLAQPELGLTPVVTPLVWEGETMRDG